MRKAYGFYLLQNRVDGINPTCYIQLGVTVSILVGGR